MGHVVGAKRDFGHELLYWRILFSMCCAIGVIWGLSGGGSDRSRAASGSWGYSSPINIPVPSNGCGRETSLQVGKSHVMEVRVNPGVARGATHRVYTVHIPSGYQSRQQLPVVLVFHGYGADMAAIEDVTAFSRLAEEQNFIAIYPQGLLDGASDKAFWASVGPIDYGINDVLFVSNVLDDVQQRLCVDARRIYATGFSNGGGMVDLLACRLSGRIAAFAPVAGNFYVLPGGCRPRRPVSLLEIHGFADRTLPYTGIDANQDPAWPLVAVPTWLGQWADRNQCKQQPLTIMRTETTTAQRWYPCHDESAIIHYRLENGGHSWPLDIEGRSSTQIIWEFFRGYFLPVSEMGWRSYITYGQAS